MNEIEFEKAYPWINSLTEHELKNLKCEDELIYWDLWTNKAVKLVIWQNDPNWQYFEAVNEETNAMTNYGYGQYSYYFYKTDGKIKLDKCTCGASHTSNPKYHLKYCEAS